jgi:hypothetical protein
MSRLYTIEASTLVRCELCDRAQIIGLAAVTETLATLAETLDSAMDAQIEENGWRGGICRECYFVDNKYIRELANADA